MPPANAPAAERQQVTDTVIELNFLALVIGFVLGVITTIIFFCLAASMAAANKKADDR